MKRLHLSEIHEPLQALLDVATPDVPLNSVKSIYIGKTAEREGQTALRISYFEKGDEDNLKAGLITKEFWLELPPLKKPTQ